MTGLIKNIINSFGIVVLVASPLFGQYWQQDVEYGMDVYLDADAKTLTGKSDLLYVNNSPDSLDQILMHLYHNAFNEGTIAADVWANYGGAFDLEKGITGISITQAMADSVSMDYLIRDDTILEITLNQILAPHDTLHFVLDWTSKIHPHIDRSGWRGQQFDFSQWYPKFVVYDENGWHDDPFGDWGEFYGEFGNFTVNLNLPFDQVVGASGVVIDGDPGWSAVSVDTSVAWDAWLETFKKDRADSLMNTDSTARRTVTFLAENVHDFAWLCSPDFVYEHGKWDGVDVHALFTTKVGDAWTKSVVEDGVSAIRWLSEKFGHYPWPQMTITKALLGGGMEYPMLVMDASDSESLIVHEIGHNWFYGLFGNDELDDAWLDEGFTTFQTNWYKAVNYPNNGYDISRNNITDFEAEHLPRQMYWEAAYKGALRYMMSPRNEPIATRSYDFKHSGSYRTNVYTKASFMLYSLKAYLGEERFLKGMALYYDRWALKHVNEERFIKAMEDASGEELDWFFDQWLHTTKYVDYKIADWHTEQKGDHFLTQVTVENLGGLFVPIEATLYGSSGESTSADLSEFRFRKQGTISINSSFLPVRVKLDATNTFLDVDRRNNDSEKLREWRYNYKGWQNYPDDRNLYLWKPQLGFTDAQGLGLGWRVDQVYRNTGDVAVFEADYNLKSGKPDLALSFKKQQVGLPFKGTAAGAVGTWHELRYAELEYELNWAKLFWKNPIHYLTVKVDYTDAEQSGLMPTTGGRFTRFGLQYELQDEQYQGDYGLSVRLLFSPGDLGTYGQDFSQLYIMDTWSRYFGIFKFNNRSNVMMSSQGTPDLVKYRIASQDLRGVYLDRSAATWQGTSGLDMIGSRYYLAGGGRMRAYTDSLDKPTNYIWSNAMDITFRASQHGIKNLDLGIFLDVGQHSVDGEQWDWLGDAGLSLSYKPKWERTNWFTTLFRPRQITIQVPLGRYETDEFVSTLSQDLWIFSVSN